MQNSKLINVLKTLSKKELKEFEKFVKSPYFGRGRNLMPIFNTIKKYHPLFNDKNFSREMVLKSIGKHGNKASESLLKLQMSELYKLAEQYISIGRWKTQPGLNTYFSINAFKHKELYSLGERKASKVSSDIEKTGIDWRHYLNYYFSKVELINILFLQDKPIKAAENVDELSEILLHQFFCVASRYVYNLNTLKVSYNKQMSDNLLWMFFEKINYSAVLKDLEKRQDRYSKASTIYILFILLQIKDYPEEHYFKFKKLLFDNIEIFSAYEKSVFLQTILSRTRHLMERDNYNKYAMEAFDIVKFRLSKNIHKQYPTAPYTSSEYFEALYIGFILKETGWMRCFIEKYINEVPEEHRSAVSLLSNAFLKFAENDYNESLQIITQTAGLPFLLNYDMRRLELMAYFELNMIDEAFYGIDAFKNYLRTNKNVTKQFMENNLNFIKYYLLILRYRLEEVEFNLKDKKKEIKSSNTGNKKWLLEKIEEITGSSNSK